MVLDHFIDVLSTASRTTVDGDDMPGGEKVSIYPYHWALNADFWLLPCRNTKWLNPALIKIIAVTFLSPAGQMTPRVLWWVGNPKDILPLSCNVKVASTIMPLCPTAADQDSPPIAISGDQWPMLQTLIMTLTSHGVGNAFTWFVSLQPP